MPGSAHNWSPRTLMSIHVCAQAAVVRAISVGGGWERNVKKKALIVHGLPVLLTHSQPHLNKENFLRDLPLLYLLLELFRYQSVLVLGYQRVSYILIFRNIMICDTIITNYFTMINIYVTLLLYLIYLCYWYTELLFSYRRLIQSSTLPKLLIRFSK